MKTFPTAHNANPQLLGIEINDFIRIFGTDPAEPKDVYLKHVFERAKYIADLYRDEDDGGTCNFDSPVVDYLAYGLPAKRVEEIAKEAGLGCYITNLFRKKYMIICGFQCGQANRRTAMAEAFAAALGNAKIPSGMYYAMD